MCFASVDIKDTIRASLRSCQPARKKNSIIRDNVHNCFIAENLSYSR